MCVLRVCYVAMEVDVTQLKNIKMDFPFKFNDDIIYIELKWRTEHNNYNGWPKGVV